MNENFGVRNYEKLDSEKICEEGIYSYIKMCRLNIVVEVHLIRETDSSASDFFSSHDLKCKEEIDFFVIARIFRPRI